MKNFLIFSLMLLFTTVIAGCGDVKAQQETSSNFGRVAAEQAKTDTAGNGTKGKALVVYFSHSGNTRALAQQIQQKTGADILELRPITPYTTVYNDLTKQARQELDSGYTPPLQAISTKFEDYDTIYLGSPIWWGTIATPVISFLSEHNLSGKVIKPFVTHGGSGIARSVTHIKELSPQAQVRDGLAIRSSAVNNSQSEVANWLSRN